MFPREQDHDASSTLAIPAMKGTASSGPPMPVDTFDHIGDRDHQDHENELGRHWLVGPR